MFNAIRILSAVISLFGTPFRAEARSTIPSVPSVGAPAPSASGLAVEDHQGPAPQVVFVGLSDAEQAAAEHTVSLFAQAGLPLPLLEIRRHHDFDLCNGHEGLHRRFGDRSVIDICTTEAGEYEQRTLTHELGHAWTEHFLTSDAKQAFQDLRGWSSWLDYKQAKWEDNGVEQAAEIIVWALFEQPVAVVKIGQNSCEDLHDGYVALTGREPLHGYTKLCKPSVAAANRS